MKLKPPFSAARLVILLALGAVAAAVVMSLITTPQPTAVADPPWEIESTDYGIRVFGIEIGRDTLQDAQRLIREEGKLTLFVTGDDRHSAEIFFERVPIGGITGSMVLTADIEHERAAEMAGRGLRVSMGATGSRKITLHPDDTDDVRAARIATLTFLPTTRLDAETIRLRFGEPSTRIREAETGAIHWLYPERGLSIALGEKKRSVLSYMRPAEFEARMAPLLATGERLQGARTE